MEKIYQSQEILNADDLAELQEMDEIKYQFTPGELQWWQFVRGRYSIADYIMNNSESTEDEQSIIVTIRPDEISEALRNDGPAPSVPCLFDDSAFHRICFWIYNDD